MSAGGAKILQSEGDGVAREMVQFEGDGVVMKCEEDGAVCSLHLIKCFDRCQLACFNVLKENNLK